MQPMRFLLAVVAVVTLFVGAGALWSLRSSGAPASPSPAQEPERAADMVSSRTVDSRQVSSARQAVLENHEPDASADPATKAPSRDELLELAVRLDELIRARERNPEPYEAIAKRLKEIGTPAAIDLLLATVARPDLEFKRESYVFYPLLRDLHDSRVLSAASAALDRVYAAGRVDSPSLAGYSDLLAELGGAEGAARVVTAVEIARAARSGASFALATSMSKSSDSAACTRLAATIGSDDQWFADRAIVEALGKSPSEHAYKDLASAAFRNTVPLEIRGVAIRTYANRIAPTEIRELLAMRAGHELVDDSIITLTGIVGLVSNPRITRDVLWSETRGALTEAVNSPEASVRSKAREVLLDLPPDKSGAMLLELEQCAARATGAQERKELERLIGLYGEPK